jgi:Fe-S cluster assembly protein SufD
VQLADLVLLRGEQSAFHGEFLGIAGGSDRFDGVKSIRHQAPWTTSSEVNLLISSGDSRMQLDVTGSIDKGCHHASCHQKNRGIILGEKGVISVEPKLVIDEFDVDAGHGCAIGQINADEMYYLQSRGLDEQTAKKLIVSGYLAPMLKKIDNPGFYKSITRLIDRQMKGADL